jgi:hypothetical protein
VSTETPVVENRLTIVNDPLGGESIQTVAFKKQDHNTIAKYLLKEKVSFKEATAFLKGIRMSASKTDLVLRTFQTELRSKQAMEKTQDQKSLRGVRNSLTNENFDIEF